MTCPSYFYIGYGQRLQSQMVLIIVNDLHFTFEQGTDRNVKCRKRAVLGMIKNKQHNSRVTKECETIEHNVNVLVL